MWFLNERRVRRCAKLACNYANASSIRGSFLLSRLANYHPERFSAYAFIDHGYSAPGHSLTTAVIQHINSSVQANLGFSIFGYFLFFNEEDAPKLLDEHVSSFQTLQILTCQTLTTLQSESVESLFFATDNEINKKYKGAPGGFRTWLTEGKTADLPAYLTSEVKFLAVMHGVSKLAYMEQDHKHYQHAFSFEKGGYGPGTNWYRAGLRNINEEDEKSMYHFPLYPVSPFLSHSISSPETCSLLPTISASY
jgi:soluble epoxide hydrolase / lipid-phosphate phosphatase